MKQVEAVIKFTKEVLGSTFDAAKPILDYITKEQRAKVVDLLTEAFLNGEVDLKDSESNEAKMNDHKVMRRYASGAVKNWYEKSKALNGNVNHKAKNPGSRKGQGDPAVREMRAALKTLTDPEAKAAFEAEIASRVAASKSTKVKEIDVSKIPENLRQFVKAS